MRGVYRHGTGLSSARGKHDDTETQEYSHWPCPDGAGCAVGDYWALRHKELGECMEALMQGQEHIAELVAEVLRRTPEC